MSRPTDIGWVEPAKPIRGLDHLGVQAPCVALYAQLLPGITNVTDRARYYSFHPWLIWSFEQRYRDHSVDEFRRVLRRAECLFALIAIRHARMVGDGDDALHGGGMVGRLSLLRIPEDAKAIVLDDHAALEGPNRYFLNKLGGLGQYYFGPLRDLRVLDYASGEGSAIPGYDKARGHALAEAFGGGVPQDEFFRLLEQPKIRWTDLDGLREFCPCGLRKHQTERSLLLDLFLARSDAYDAPEAGNRRASLTLALDLISRRTWLDDYSPEDVFRASTYGRALPDGTPWKVHPSLLRTQQGWATYQTNELLSVALQALFSAVLGAVARDRAGRLQSAAAAGDVCVDLLSPAGGLRNRRVADVVSELSTSLPALSAWQDEAHEMQRGWRILEAGTEDSGLTVLVEEGVHLLLSLLARGLDENPYRDFEFDPDHFDAREVHLLSFKQAWNSTWADMTVEQWVRWIRTYSRRTKQPGIAGRRRTGQPHQRPATRAIPRELGLRVPAGALAGQWCADSDFCEPSTPLWN